MRAHVCVVVNRHHNASLNEGCTYVVVYMETVYRYNDTIGFLQRYQLHRPVSTSYTMISTVCWLRTHNIHMDTHKCSRSHSAIVGALTQPHRCETRWPALVCAQITPSFSSISPVFVRQTHQTVWTQRNIWRCIIFCVLSASESNCAR